MFDGLWPGFDEAEVPIASITNGVHAPTWVAREVFELAAKHGADPETDDIADLWDVVDRVPATRSGRLKRTLREQLVDDARRRLRALLGRARRRAGRARLDRRRRSTPTC